MATAKQKGSKPASGSKSVLPSDKCIVGHSPTSCHGSEKVDRALPGSKGRLNEALLLLTWKVFRQKSSS